MAWKETRDLGKVFEGFLAAAFPSARQLTTVAGEVSLVVEGLDGFLRDG